MAGGCCPNPIAKIIKVGGLDVGILGLENVLQGVYATGIQEETQLKHNLLVSVRALGNFVPPSREEEYKEALLREYRKFCRAMEDEAEDVRRHTR
jgi:hypothetical protein